MVALELAIVGVLDVSIPNHTNLKSLSVYGLQYIVFLVITNMGLVYPYATTTS